MKITERPLQLPRTERVASIAAIVVLAFPVLLYRVGDREVSGIVEERVAITSREMWRGGEWILPTMNGEPRLQKPPLAYWLPHMMASLRGRFDDVTLRLPFAILAIASLLLAYGIGCVLLGSSGGLLTAIVLLTTPLFAKSGRMATPDGALLFCVVGALFCHVLARRPGSPGDAPSRRIRRARIAFFAFLGLGALAKGPVILAVTVLPILVEALVTRSREPLRALRSPVGLAVFALLSLSWPGLVATRPIADSTGSTPVHLWVLESFGKVLPSEGIEDGYEFLKHPEPWYYHFTRLVPVFGVWAAALPLVVYRAIAVIRRQRTVNTDDRGEASTDMALRTALVWFVTMLLFFSCVSEKKTAYLLPLLPAGAVMIAAVLPVAYARCRRGLRAVAGVGVALSLGGLSLVSILALSPRLSSFAGSHLSSSLAALVTQHTGSVLALGALASMGFLLVRRLAVLHEPALPLFALGGTLALLMMPYRDLRLSDQSPRKMVKEGAMAVSRLVDPEREVYVIGDHVGFLPGGMAYYLDCRLVFLERENPEKLRELPVGSALLVPAKSGAGLVPSTWVTSDSEHLPLDGILEGYSLVRVVNPRAREKDKVTLLEKRS